MTPEIQEFMENSELVFFKPTDAFWTHLRQTHYRWRRFVDIGAGNGSLTRQMRERGFTVDAIDKYLRKSVEIPDMIVGCAAGLDPHRKYAFEFSTGDVMLFARPCHGAFVGLCLRLHIDSGDAFYISKPHNAPDDLFGWLYEEVAQNVGEGGESMFRVWGKIGLMKTFHKVQSHPNIPKSYWMEYDKARDRYVNTNGGYMPADGREPVADQQAQHAGMLPNIDFHFRDDSLAGWLAPDGTFYGCDSSQHDYLAYDVFGASTPHLEKIGFCRLYGEFHGNMLWAMGRDRKTQEEKKPTLAQRKVLKAKGYDLKMWGDDLLADASFPL